MRELVRTNDAVLITAIEALLNGAAHQAPGGGSQYERAGRLDRHFPSPHSGRRGGVRCSAAASRRSGLRGRAPARWALNTLDVTEDAVLGGRLVLRQPRKGHRVGHDAILLAAACSVRARERLIELGAGVGAAGLAVARRVSDLDAHLDRDRSGAGGDGARQRRAQWTCRTHARRLPRRRSFAGSFRRRWHLSGGGGSCADESAIQRRA